MKSRTFFLISGIAALLTVPTKFVAGASLDEMLAKRKPEATIDLATKEGVQLVKGEWRYSDTKIVEIDFKAAGADGQPTGASNKTYDFTPHAGGVEFDDSKWEVIDPTTLAERRSAGRLAFNWYRIKITVPERGGNFDPAGSTLVFATSIDDYAEIWVDGELPRAAGQSGGSVIKGWNAENRLIVGRDVKPGQKIQLAVFGINGPVSIRRRTTSTCGMRSLNSTRCRGAPSQSHRKKSTWKWCDLITRSTPSFRIIRRSLNSPKVFNSPKGRSG
jgi:gluconolactonase